MAPRRLRAAGFGVLVAGLAVFGCELHLRSLEGAVDLRPSPPERLYATRPHSFGSNSHGFHERELPREPHGARRIAVLGDSMTWGTGSADQAWTRVAEAALGPPWEVLNFSTYGYDTAQERATLAIALEWSPDFVVVAAYVNDLVPTRVIELGGIPAYVALDGGWLGPLRPRLALARALDGLAWAWSADGADEPARFAEELAGLRDEAHVPVLLWAIPPHALSGGEEACARVSSPGACARATTALATIGAAAEAVGVPHHGALPDLRATGKSAFFPDDPRDWEHFGPEGHVVLGHAFARWFSAWADL